MNRDQDNKVEIVSSIEWSSGRWIEEDKKLLRSNGSDPSVRSMDSNDGDIEVAKKLENEILLFKEINISFDNIS